MLSIGANKHMVDNWAF